MGKTKRILNKARKEYFKELEDKLFNQTDEIYEETDDEFEEDTSIKIDRISNKLRFMIFEYCRENALPMCEYLDIDTMRNYLEWILNKS